ncbi:MAG: RDD family protein [Acidobacteria bacterium]|nr:RDD family protein [Acidobacteriota bacterium]
MKKKDEQRLLKFPSVFNLEPGGKSSETGPVSPKIPSWKKEVARKVEQHLQKRDLKKDPAAADFDRRMETNSEKKVLDERFSGPDKVSGDAKPGGTVTVNLPPREPAPPDLPLAPRPETHRVSHPPREEIKQNLKQEFADLAQQFRKVSTGSTQEIQTEDAVTDLATSFDEIDLTKNPAPTLPEAPSEKRAEEPEDLQTEDYFMPLGELLQRHQKKEKTVTGRKRDAAATDRTILVSRFLAGLIDFVLVLVMSAGLVAITAYFTGRDPFSTGMGWLLAGMLVFLLYVYSFFFLYLNGRTIGMMLVGLQVVAGGKHRLPLGTALLRTTVFIAATVLLGCGLLWGIVRPDAKCWQDILTDSDVIRVD